ncbi:Hsp20/alpha crystallin family protein [Metabacillus sp. RGM 3146]|uniref:Hsp20/alpha crystallin family protein n=1 Tax=Metabacillus sp. RGM 3146 TaxID=3401092 RepID=UPI003B9C0A14
MTNNKKPNYSLSDFIKDETPFLNFADQFFRSEPLKHFLNEFNSLIQQSCTFPLLDIETAVNDHHVVVEAKMAGLKQECFEAEVFDRCLTLTVTHKEESKTIIEDSSYYQQTASLSNFSRSILLPYPVEEDDMQMIFKKDAVVILLPKKELI